MDTSLGQSKITLAFFWTYEQNCINVMGKKWLYVNFINTVISLSVSQILNNFKMCFKSRECLNFRPLLDKILCTYQFKKCK